MKQRRHTPEQVVRKLREADRTLAEGKTIPEVAKALEVSENTFHRWRAQYGGMKADDVKRLKELERENTTLKGSSRTRRWRSRGSRRSRRETGEPVAPTSGGPDAQGSPRHLGAAGVSDRSPASLHAAP